MHNAAFAALGLDLRYLAFDVLPDALPDAVTGLGALGARGANVTVPHKLAALTMAHLATQEAETVGAANTLRWDDGRLLADNTDARGLEDVLTGEVGLKPGEGVLLVGAGGAALAAALALGRLGARVEVLARRLDAVERLEGRLRAAHAEVGPVDGPAVVINATPLGLQGEALPDRAMRLGPGQVALDLVYGRERTPFQAAALRGGARAVDGLGLLVAQAGRSFTFWTGLDAPHQVMRAAAVAALGRPD